MTATLLNIALIYIPVAWSPGPNFIIVSKASLGGNRSQGVLTAFGISSGTFFWVTLAASGITYLNNRYEWAQAGMQLAGGGYLAYLGLRSLKNANKPIKTQVLEQSKSPALMRAYRNGLTASVANPQSLAFFSSLFSSILTAQESNSTRLWAIFVVMCISIVSYQIQAIALSNPTMQKQYIKGKFLFDLVAGMALIYMAANLYFMALT